MSRREHRLEVQLERVIGVVERVDAKVDATGKQAEQLVEIQRGQLVAMQRQMDGQKDDLKEHAAAVNPHPTQEDWIRKHLASQGTEISEIKSALDSFKGSLKVFGPLIVVIGGVATAVISKALGA